MADIVEISDFLKSKTDLFEVKKRMFVFSDLIYKPTGEKVIEGFRYFTCSIDDLISAFEARDLDAIANLPFAEDEDGDPDTSAVCLLMAYTESGGFLALQPQEYQDYNPTLVREPVFIEGSAGLGQRALSLDQSS